MFHCKQETIRSGKQCIASCLSFFLLMVFHVSAGFNVMPEASFSPAGQVLNSLGMDTMQIRLGYLDTSRRTLSGSVASVYEYPGSLVQQPDSSSAESVELLLDLTKATQTLQNNERNFLFETGSREFSHVSVYYHVTKASEYLRSIGVPLDKAPVNVVAIHDPLPARHDMQEEPALIPIAYKNAIYLFGEQQIQTPIYIYSAYANKMLRPFFPEAQSPLKDESSCIHAAYSIFLGYAIASFYSGQTVHHHESLSIDQRQSLDIENTLLYDKTAKDIIHNTLALAGAMHDLRKEIPETTATMITAEAASTYKHGDGAEEVLAAFLKADQKITGEGYAQEIVKSFGQHGIFSTSQMTAHAAPEIDLLEDQVIAAGQKLSFEFSVTSTEEDALLVYVSNDDVLPGAKIFPGEKQRYIFSWTPDASMLGTQIAQITASNGKETSTRLFQIMVTETPGLSLQNHNTSH